MNWFDILTFAIPSVLSALAYILCIKKKRICFVLWQIGTVGFVIGCLYHGIYWQLLLWGFYLITNVVGWFAWKGNR